MPLSWNEIRARAVTFAHEASDASRERGEAQTFWNEFFQVFGVRRRTVASFEEPVRNLRGATDYIDLLWPGRLICEHKSRGGNLDKAHTQAMGYITSLHNNDRGEEAPRYILVSDFARFALHDLEPEDGQSETVEFDLADLPANVRHFAFIAGYDARRLDPEDPANEDATRRLANLHDRLADGGFTGHHLERFMVRVLFCLFAEDTGIFEPESFTAFFTQRTAADGSDTGVQLGRLFQVLNSPPDQRQQNLDEMLAHFPYVNGDLFAERLDFPEFNAAMRTALLVCCNFKWEKISPAVFGSLFQEIMQAPERRQIGAHYTSERDIMKLIRSLFLDDLRARFANIRHDRPALARFHRELGEMRFLDPACGCGNFLVIAYRELRRLELDALQSRFGDNPTEADIRAEARLNVGQFYGIEIEEWPVRIAEVAMWLMDHQMNAELFARFDKVKPTVPLTRSPHIVQGNALRLDWNEVLPAGECTYILGNPPFVGKAFMSAAQRQDMARVFNGVSGAGVLDFVTAWYVRAGEYMGERNIRAAFVSTNSITQGEQVGVLWQELFRRFHSNIHFGHRTFSWSSEARGMAHVHVVIIGFGREDLRVKRLYEYENDEDEPTTVEARSINPYLIEGGPTVIRSRTRPLGQVPPLVFGSMPNDGGHLLLNGNERDELLAREPGSAPYIRPFVGSREFINGETRWCLWLKDARPDVLRRLPAIMDRIEQVRVHRKASTRETTNELANKPTLFGEDRQPAQRFLVVPSVSSETRPYIPMGFLEPLVIASNLCLTIEAATAFHFGILTSAMHMAWVRQVCGRLESRYRYSARLVYNNFPWPTAVSDSNRGRVEQAAQRVLDARSQFPDATLADLYDPNAMPPALRRTHESLDRAVDRCYRPQPFTSERQRLEFLFNLYEQLVAPLAPRTPARRARRPRAG